MNEEKIANDLADIIEEHARRLLEGATSDLRVYVLAISADMAKAAFSDDREALMEELLAQLKAVAEINRLRATKEAWATFESVVQALGRMVLRMVI